MYILVTCQNGLVSVSRTRISPQEFPVGNDYMQSRIDPPYTKIKNRKVLQSRRLRSADAVFALNTVYLSFLVLVDVNSNHNIEFRRWLLSLQIVAFQSVLPFPGIVDGKLRQAKRVELEDIQYGRFEFALQ